MKHQRPHRRPSRRRRLVLSLWVLCGFGIIVVSFNIYVSRKIQAGYFPGSLSSAATALPVRPPVPPYDQVDKNDPAAATSNHSQSSTAPRLQCQEYGGPHATTAAAEMVYWKDTSSSDATFVSPLQHSTRRQYLTVEYDEGGFNNIRLAFETAVALAASTGRILVLPPKMGLYLLSDETASSSKRQKKSSLGVQDFFDLESIASSQQGLEMISFQEFLETEAMTGQLLDRRTGLPTFPPQNRTNWDGFAYNMLTFRQDGTRTLWDWLRQVTLTVDWEPMECIAAIPNQRGPAGVLDLVRAFEMVKQQDEIRRQNIPFKAVPVWRNRYYSFDGNPAPVDAAPEERLSEMVAERQKICLYNQEYQQAKVIHIMGEQQSGSRMLIHHYAFLFYHSWQQHLWMQRFIRDHFRYKDELQCAAARIVQTLRAIARSVTNNQDENSGFDTMHIRRGDFQFGAMWISARDIYQLNTHKMIQEGRVVYIATDEKDKTFFQPLQEHYRVYFLDDFKHLLKDIDSHYFGTWRMYSRKKIVACITEQA